MIGQIVTWESVIGQIVFWESVIGQIVVWESVIGQIVVWESAISQIATSSFLESKWSIQRKTVGAALLKVTIWYFALAF